MRVRFYWVAGLMLAALSVGGLAQVPQPFTFDDAQLQNYSVKIDIENQIAHVQIEQTYYNPTDRVLEEIYLFPVQKGATISSLTLCNDDTGCTEGELLGATEARQLYQNIVRQSRDPALLEYLDDRSFQVRIFPINPDSTQTIKVSYQVVLNRSNELVEVVYPITSQKNIQQMLIQATINSDEPIGNVYSPSHTITQERVSENEVRIGFEANNLKSDNDFKFYYAVAQDGIALDVLSFKPNENEDGYFLMLVSWPQIDRDALPKDVVFVLDTSGSMSGEKIEQARASLRHALGRLNPEDRIGLVTFSDVIRAYSTELIQLSELDRPDIESYISGIDAAGGTDIHAAMLRGLDLFENASEERPQFVVFLTDGLPTSGITNVTSILEDVLAKSGNMSCRIFTFGVGYDVNTILLDTLSLENGGFTTYVEPGENIEDSIAAFYDRVGTPLIWDLESNFTGIDVFDVYPVTMPDLFEGDMLEIAGRYRTGGTAQIELLGQGAGMRQSFSDSADFSQGWTDNEYLKKIWAGRAIGHLLTQIRLHGENPELVERVRQLGETYGIVTPYTSLFANPEGDDGFDSGFIQNRFGSFDSDPSAPQDASGQGAVQASEALNMLSQMSSAEEAESFSSTAQKMLGGVTFQQQNGRWVDASSANAEPDVQIQFGSDAYFALADRSDLTEILKLGSQLVFTTKTSSGEDITVEIGDLGIASASQLPSGLAEPVAQNTNQNNTDNQSNNQSGTDQNNQNANNQNSDQNQNNAHDNTASSDATSSSDPTANPEQAGGPSTLLLIGIGLAVAILVGGCYWMMKK